jgi:delta(3,5)-delta(2,4)-dienoyl-CoA isomerase
MNGFVTTNILYFSKRNRASKFVWLRRMEENYKTLEIVEKAPKSGVLYLNLNRPAQRNALTYDFFCEFPKALYALDNNPDVKVIVLSGAGSHFCSGIDLSLLKSTGGDSNSGSGESLRRQIMAMQDSVTALERCRKPVIASIHGGCIGGGIDIITACDIRVCTEEAFFSVKEVDLALAADLGTLQRLPGIVGFGNAMELALTARRFSGLEAKEMGLISRVFHSKHELDEGVRDLAQGWFSYLFIYNYCCLCCFLSFPVCPFALHSYAIIVYLLMRFNFLMICESHYTTLVD